MLAGTNAATADLTALVADLQAASAGGMQKSAHDVLQQGAVRTQAESQLRAPVKTGALRTSIAITWSSPLEVVIGPKVDYGVFQEFGTGERGEFGGSAYMIRSKTAGGVLVFTIGRRKVYARSVRHPGVRPKRYMRRGLVAALGESLASQLAEAGALLITKGPQ